MTGSYKKILLGGGCFWCLEAVFQRLDAVKAVTPGYAGGKTENPTYREICTGTTGHAEVILIEYDEDYISLDELLEVFFTIHDPTTLNRQGNDCGTQYRSIVCYQDDNEKKIIEKSIKLHQSNLSKKIVTQVEPLDIFYPAEVEHKDYYNQNANQPYCQIVIGPKLAKLQSLQINQKNH